MRFVRIDGTQQRGEWLSADAASIRVRIDGAAVRIPRDDLMLIAFARQKTTSRPAALGSGETICTLADGGVIRGELDGGDDGAIHLRATPIGDLSLRFADLAGIRPGWIDENAKAQGELKKWLAKRPVGNDVLIALRDGNVTVVRGALVVLGPNGGTFTVGGRTLPFRTDITYAVVFGGGLSATPAGTLTVALRDGSQFTAAITTADANSLSLALAGQRTASVPIAEVEQIAVRSPRVTFASDMPPSDVKFEPYLDTPWPYRRDRAVSNRPMRLGGIEYLKGLGVHSRSEIAFDLDGRYRQFAATIGIDDSVRPRGNVVFRILTDNREAFSSGPVTGKDEPRPILVDVARAKQVRLIVEFGDELDLGDHADWANARFIR